MADMRRNPPAIRDGLQRLCYAGLRAAERALLCGVGGVFDKVGGDPQVDSLAGSVPVEGRS